MHLQCSTVLHHAIQVSKTTEKCCHLEEMGPVLSVKEQKEAWTNMALKPVCSPYSVKVKILPSTYCKLEKSWALVTYTWVLGPSGSWESDNSFSAGCSTPLPFLSQPETQSKVNALHQHYAKGEPPLPCYSLKLFLPLYTVRLM